ncbi:molybdopterin-binding domain of aldehyde dehydrogenase family protein [Mycobacterium xenopi 3993]|nr:molybdopterin-binding domain of aldehyde dehydrogenase family protein [Mycobacterium xenopi 3993]
MTAGAVNEAGTMLRSQIVAIAAHYLGVAESDVELANSRAAVRDDPTRSVGFAELAYRAYYEPQQLPPGMSASLEATARFTSQAPIHWANATHACTCEVDVETGQVKLLRYIVSEDVGPMINPNVVEGQIAAAQCKASAARCWRTWSTTTTATPWPPRSSTICCQPPARSRPSSSATSKYPDPVSGIQGRRRGRCHRIGAGGDQRDQRCPGAAGCDAHRAAGQPAAIVNLIEQGTKSGV